MRTLSADLLAAQSTPDPEATVTARFKRRGTFAGDPLAWRPLFLHSALNLPYGDANVTAAACACAENGAMVRALRSELAMKVGVQRFNVLNWTGTGSSWPAAAVTAMTAAPTDLATLTVTGAGESSPGIYRINSEIRLVFADGGRLWQVRSTDDGATWPAATSAWNLTGTYTCIDNIEVAAAGGRFMCVFNARNAAGQWVVRGMHGYGAGWAGWIEMPYAGIDWQVAGLRATPDRAHVYVYLWAVTGGCSVLACQHVTLSGVAGGFSAWTDTPQVVDRAGTSDAVNYDRVRFGDAGGAYLFALQEKAVNGYWFVSSLFGLPGSLDMEEPVYLTQAGLSPALTECFQPLQAGNRAWLVGASGIYASAQADAIANLDIRTVTPVTYRYDAAANGGGLLSMALERSRAVDAPPEGFATVATPDVYVGDILWLDRTLSTGAQSGTMTLAFRVLEVVYTRDRVEVLAADALGVLAHMRARRPKRFAAGERQRMADVDALVHWVGLHVAGSGTLPQAVWGSPGFVWEANETALGALRRYLMDQVTALRSKGADPNGDGSPSQEHTTVALFELPTASSYTYVTPAGLDEGCGSHEVSGWALRSDSRPARLLVANGLADDTDPLGEAGPKGWVIAAARTLPGSRPYPLSITDYTFAASGDNRLAELAGGQAQWLLYDVPLGWIEAVANLGVELYDVVTVDETAGRVVRIVETWERGRLRQRLDLAEVNTYGVAV